MANDVGPLWYNTGTATVAQGDTLVTFQDEGNLYDIVRTGDDFGAHVQRPTRIKSIDQANSQATLAYPWPGPSQTAAPYEISFNPQISAYRIPVRTILSLLRSGNVAALAKLAGEADTMPYFKGPGQMGRTGLTKLARSILGRTNAAGMRGDLDVAQKQSGVLDGTDGRGLVVGAFGLGDNNAEIVTTAQVDTPGALRTGFYRTAGYSINGGSSTACLLQVQKYGTNNNNTYQKLVSLQNDVAYERLFSDNDPNIPWNTLLTVHGSNSNGNFIQIGGTLICILPLSAGARASASALVANPNIYRSATSAGTSYNWRFPKAFAIKPSVMVNGDYFATMAYCGTSSASEADLFIMSLNGQQNNMLVSAVAVGEAAS